MAIFVIRKPIYESSLPFPIYMKEAILTSLSYFPSHNWGFFITDCNSSGVTTNDISSDLGFRLIGFFSNYPLKI